MIRGRTRYHASDEVRAEAGDFVTGTCDSHFYRIGHTPLLVQGEAYFASPLILPLCSPSSLCIVNIGKRPTESLWRQQQRRRRRRLDNNMAATSQIEIESYENIVFTNWKAGVRSYEPRRVAASGTVVVFVAVKWSISLRLLRAHQATLPGLCDFGEGRPSPQNVLIHVNTVSWGSLLQLRCLVFWDEGAYDDCYEQYQHVVFIDVKLHVPSGWLIRALINWFELHEAAVWNTSRGILQRFTLYSFGLINVSPLWEIRSEWPINSLCASCVRCVVFWAIEIYSCNDGINLLW